MIDLNEQDDDEICISNNSNEDNDNGKNKPHINRRVIEALQTVPWTAFEKIAEKESERVIKAGSEGDKNLEQVGGDFEDLMSKLSTFKQNSDDLPREERYAYAEKIALKPKI